MQVKRYFQRRKVNKQGFAPIILTASWDGKRAELYLNEKAHLEAWDNERKKVKSKQTYTTRINAKLEAGETAIIDFYDEARKKGKSVSVEQVKEVFYNAISLEKIEAAPEPAVQEIIHLIQPATIPTTHPDQVESEFFRLMNQWILHKKTERDDKGNRIEKSTVTSIIASRNRFQEFEKAKSFGLSLAKMDNVFFQAFLNYMLEDLQQSINTVGKHIKRLTDFLEWCEDQDYEVNRKYRKMSVTESYDEVEALTEDEVKAIFNLDFRTQEAVEFVKQAFREEFGKEINRLMLAQRIKVLEEMRDVFLFLCYTGLRISDAFQLTPKHIQGNIIKIKAGKTKKFQTTCYIPYFDDHIFKPVEIIEKYRGQYATCLPVNKAINVYLKYIGQLAGITRLELITKIGRKTFTTLKLYQGVPDRMVMQATGHKTEKSFVRYIGVHVLNLVRSFKSSSIHSATVSATVSDKENN